MYGLFAFSSFLWENAETVAPPESVIVSVLAVYQLYLCIGLSGANSWLSSLDAKKNHTHCLQAS
jgi:hypothetical protein